MLSFDPPALLRGRHVQSIFGSTAVRGRIIRTNLMPVAQLAQNQIIDCGDGVRLLAEHTPPRGTPSGRVAVFIHGWEGSSSSTYVLSAATRLWQAGDRILRLNLRDHGASHHLNRDIFHSCRLAEVIGAVRAIQNQYQEKLVLGGFSLGGNFILRIVALAEKNGIDVEKAVAICPVLDPEQTMSVLDNGFFVYKQYFLKKWRASLERKKSAFPDVYDFTDLERFDNLTEMTEYFVEHFTEYPSLTDYLRGYAITGDRLASLSAPCKILLADDDPVIPSDDISRVARSDNLTIHRSAHGGHCGFLSNLKLTSWADDFVAASLS